MGSSSARVTTRATDRQACCALARLFYTPPSSPRWWHVTARLIRALRNEPASPEAARQALPVLLAAPHRGPLWRVAVAVLLQSSMQLQQHSLFNNVC